MSAELQALRVAATISWLFLVFILICFSSRPPAVFDSQYGTEWVGFVEMSWLTPWTFTPEVCRGGIFDHVCYVDNSVVLREALIPTYDRDLTYWLAAIGFPAFVNGLISANIIYTRFSNERASERWHEAQRAREIAALNSSPKLDIRPKVQSSSDPRPAIVAGAAPVPTRATSGYPPRSVPAAAKPQSHRPEPSVRPVVVPENATPPTPNVSAERPGRDLPPGSFSTAEQLAAALKRDPSLRPPRSMSDAPASDPKAPICDQGGAPGLHLSSPPCLPITKAVASPHSNAEARLKRAARLARLAQGHFDPPANQISRPQSARSDTVEPLEQDGDDA